MMTEHTLENSLEIFLITYNRNEFLENTLVQLRESPFARCRITILDNCSTDLTQQVTAQFSDRFPNFRVIRHNRNIGGDYNFLRAVELSTSVYTWILCDDDSYDFTHADEVVAAVESHRYDLVYVASRSPVQLGCSRFGGTTVRQLMREGARCHRAFAFWPSLIFRTEQYENYCLHNAPFLFPSFNFISKSVMEDFSIYVSEHEMVIRFLENKGEIHPLKMYKEWVANAARIPDMQLRGSVIEQWTDKGFLRTLVFWIALERSRQATGYWKQLIDILFALTPWQKVQFVMLFPVMIIPIPLPLLKHAREVVYRMMGHEDVSTLPPIEIEER